MTSTPCRVQNPVLTAGCVFPVGGLFCTFPASASRRAAALCRVPASRLLPLTPARVCAAGPIFSAMGSARLKPSSFDLKDSA